MKGDFSRETFNPRKRYSGVLMQQGRVQIDADWNEQLAIANYRTELEAKDVIGARGVPKKTDGFRVEPLSAAGGGIDLAIAAGRIYVEGLLCESEATPVPISFIEGQSAVAVAHLDVDGRALEVNQWVEVSADDVPEKKNARINGVDADRKTLTFDDDISAYEAGKNPNLRRVTTYTTQPDLPAPPFVVLDGESQTPRLELPGGTYLAYLHVWQRHITALDDEFLSEKALGGADTTTRIKNVWQVELLRVTTENGNGGSDKLNCQTSFPEFDALTASSTGTLNARTEPVEEPTACLLPPSAGYHRLENQLYRVEVHTGGMRDEATFKWSRDNGSIQTSIQKIDGNTITVSEIGKDEALGFANGDWVEIVDDDAELKGASRPLALIEGIEPATREITLDTSLESIKDKPHLKLRRWHQSGDAATADGVRMNDGWISIEDGIQVQFSEGRYRTGDYWMIPARAATADIEWSPFANPNTDPLPQLPRGVAHHYCRLALLEAVEGSISVVADCRDLFPSLTDICAEDVCFDNSECKLPNAETVQDALDALCKARDLRHHNKHLHGWGIVCGLQVQCGRDATERTRRRVTVRSGYAIDCEGNDIILEKPQSLDVFEMIAEHNRANPNAPIGQLDEAGNGEVCLVLDREARRRFRLEKYTASPKGWEGLLQDTLLMDFYKDCLGSLSDFAREELTAKPEESKFPVGPTQKRLTTLMNLLIQITNPAHGRFVYLSGEQGVSDPKTEHMILRNFYERLRALLQSKTFCAMFEGARQFPEYPFKELGTDTIFGKNFHTRLRLHPNGRAAYTTGATNKINVYDLESNEMVVELEFPGKGAEVQDVAFSPNGNQLYAVATINDKDTLFAVADITGFNHKWRNPTVVCDVLLLTLGTLSNVADKVFAIGKGKGLYEFNPNNIPTTTPAPMYAFNAVGHLVIADSLGQAFATARVPEKAPDVYDRVLRLNLRAKDSNLPVFLFQQPATGAQISLTGDDDIAVTFTGRRQSKLYVVTNPPPNANTKRLLIFDALNEQQPPSTIDLEDDTAIRLGFNQVTSSMMLTYEDRYCVRLLNADERLEPVFRYPVQISPIAIATAPKRERVYVLNAVSNTITSIPAKRLTSGGQLDIEALAKYRGAVLEAYADLFGALLQYLKDCLCDHFLAGCPQCEPEDKIYLACISIKNRQVFRVCNFSKRKYVKSFPTVEYWLSLVPIIPLISKAVESFCCSVLPAYFGRFTAPKPITGTRDRVRGASIRGGVTTVQQTDFRSTTKDALGRWNLVGDLARDWFVRGRKKGGVTRQQIVSQKDVIGTPIGEAQSALKRNDITVAGVESYDPKKGMSNLRRFAVAPGELEPGTRVTLVEENGVVRYYALATAGRDAPREVSPTAEDAKSTDKLSDEVSALREELTRLHTDYEKELAKRDEMISTLRATTNEIQANLKALNESQGKEKSVTKQPRKPGKPK